MLAVIAFCAAGVAGAAVLVITASMLSSRISRNEDYLLGEDYYKESASPTSPSREVPQSPN